MFGLGEDQLGVLALLGIMFAVISIALGITVTNIGTGHQSEGPKVTSSRPYFTVLSATDEVTLRIERMDDVEAYLDSFGEGSSCSI